jgi:hypothetical protein
MSTDANRREFALIEAVNDGDSAAAAALLDHLRDQGEEALADELALLLQAEHGAARWRPGWPRAPDQPRDEDLRHPDHRHDGRDQEGPDRHAGFAGGATGPNRLERSSCRSSGTTDGDATGCNRGAEEAEGSEEEVIEYPLEQLDGGRGGQGGLEPMSDKNIAIVSQAGAKGEFPKHIGPLEIDYEHNRVKVEGSWEVDQERGCLAITSADGDVSLVNPELVGKAIDALIRWQNNR